MLDSDPPDVARDRVTEASRKLLGDAAAPNGDRAVASLAFSVGMTGPDDPIRALAAVPGAVGSVVVTLVAASAGPSTALWPTDEH